MWASGSNLLQLAEATLNRWIEQSGSAQSIMRELEGRSMLVDVDHTSWRMLLRVSDQSLRLDGGGADVHADITIRAAAVDLIALLRADALSDVAAGPVEFRGNLRVAEKFAQVLRLARPQLEDELAGWVGGTPARAVSVAGEALAQWGRRTAAALQLNTVEYLRCELAEVPYSADTAEFMRSVENLRDDVDRFARRVERLAARLSAVESR